MRLSLCALTIAVLANTGEAQVTAMTNQTQWQNAAGSFSTIDFTDYPEFTTITDQYEDLGILFIDGNDFIRISAFPTDDHGLASFEGFGNEGTIRMQFTEQSYSLAFVFLGHLYVEFYNEGQLIFTSNQYTADFTPFVGFISTVPFDLAIARDFTDDVVAIGDIHFGPPIPAPGGVLLVAIAAMARSGRRRRT